MTSYFSDCSGYIPPFSPMSAPVSVPCAPAAPAFPCGGIASSQFDQCGTKTALWVLLAVVVLGLFAFFLSWALGGKKAPSCPPCPAVPRPVTNTAAVALPLQYPAPTVTAPTVATSVPTNTIATAPAATVRPSAPAATVNRQPLVTKNAGQIDSGTDLASLKSSGSTFIVMFYADWCGHCIKAHPAYDQAALGSSVPLFVMNSKAIPSSEGIKGFPTIRAYNVSGTTSTKDYTGNRSTEDIRTFANSC